MSEGTEIGHVPVEKNLYDLDPEDNMVMQRKNI